ncbi:MAG: hypothetical protein K2H34_08335 [Lachnospiraceae bacterium]|nr:hypothetical protein [Lachnospiraceae bacterium]
MSMKINESYNYYKTDYMEQLKAGQEKAKETEKGENDEKASDKIPVPHDEYINSEKSDAKPNGLYRIGQDENGKRKVFFDDPEKTAEKCTANTDKVDREIKKLKEKQQQLEQQIKSASGDEEKVRVLEKKLAQVEMELGQKDNDAYRRQNASFFE